MTEVLLKTLIGMLTATVGYLVREVNKVKEQLQKRPTVQEMDTYVDLKLEVHKLAQKDIKDDIKEIKDKIDKLIDMNLNKD